MKFEEYQVVAVIEYAGGFAVRAYKNGSSCWEDATCCVLWESSLPLPERIINWIRSSIRFDDVSIDSINERLSKFPDAKAKKGPVCFSGLDAIAMEVCVKHIEAYYRALEELDLEENDKLPLQMYIVQPATTTQNNLFCIRFLQFDGYQTRHEVWYNLDTALSRIKDLILPSEADLSEFKNHWKEWPAPRFPDEPPVMLPYLQISTTLLRVHYHLYLENSLSVLFDDLLPSV
jgi:hypothetical protein